MTITFFSNFLNDHQLPFCNAIISKVGLNNFHFVAHEKIAEDRIQMGFEDMNETYSFVIKAFEGGEQETQAKELMLDSDVVIIGYTVNTPVKQRLSKNKLTFRYSERILKTGDLHLLDPRYQKGIFLDFTRFRNKPLYTLCASAYTARDLMLFGYPRRKCYKWGYFPVVKSYNNVESMINGKQWHSILWVGRFISWKHPELAVEVARILKNEGYSFNLNMIGVGEVQKSIESLIIRYNLSDRITLLGALPPKRVREEMEKSEIFLFTSDKNEGWGAVLNESMNSACAVVANKSIGSVPFVLKDNKNGLIYNGNVMDAYNKVKVLLDDTQKRKMISREAYNTMKSKWNADSAVNSLFILIDSILNDKDNPIKDGPCSYA